MSMVRVKSYKVGDMIPVQPVPGGYPLPEGLPESAVVLVVRSAHAYLIVEWQGKEFRVYMANMHPGLEELRTDEEAQKPDGSPEPPAPSAVFVDRGHWPNPRIPIVTS